jgi:3-oxoacyl-[acyl-carrier-protein] synthase II
MVPTATESLAVTGIGCISGFGVGTSAFERGLFDGLRAYAPVTAFDTSAAHAHAAGHLDDFDPATLIAPAKLRRMDRVGQLAVAACRLALEDAHLPGTPAVDASEIGIALGTETAGIHSLVGYLDRLFVEGPLGASALDFSNTVGNAAASLCGIEFGLRGINVTLASREASALAAITHAASVLRAGRGRAVVTGGVDDFERLYFEVHDWFRALATDEGAGEASRPFDRRRNGVVLGCGAFLLVLEAPGSAASRAATPLAFISGVGATASSCNMHEWPSDPAQLVRCMRGALDEAHVTPRDVSVVFASANSTQGLDRVEAQAIAEVFGPAAVPVTAVKGALGECGASAGAAVVAAILSLRSKRVPPTAGFEVADPDCCVDVAATTRAIESANGSVALVNSFARGGANFSLVVTHER